MTRVIDGMLFRCDRAGRRLDDLTDLVVSGSVEYSAARSGATPLLGRFTLREADVLQPFVDFVSPYLILEEEDRTRITKRMGVYVVTLPRERHTLRTAEPTYELRDLTELLARGGEIEPHVVPIGRNLVTELKSTAAEVGLTRFSFPNTSRTTGYKRTYPPGTSYLTRMNRLAEGFDWYPVWMNLDGQLTSRPAQLLSQTTPIATLTTDDPVDVVEIVPTEGQIANIVTVIRDRGDEPPLEWTEVNDDPESPSSTVNIGPVLLGNKPYEDRDAETLDDVKALARRLLEQARSYERTVTMKVEPDPDLLGMWRTLDLQISTLAGANLRGRYWVNGWRCGFTPREAAMQLTLQRLVRFGFGEEA